jgi:hypothetical protein
VTRDPNSTVSARHVALAAMATERLRPMQYRPAVSDPVGNYQAAVSVLCWTIAQLDSSGVLAEVVHEFRKVPEPWDDGPA